MSLVQDTSHTALTSEPVSLSTGACIGCGRCMVACPHGVFSTANGRAVLVDPEACTRCGTCMMNCPVGAIAVEGIDMSIADFIEGLLKGLDTEGGRALCS